MRVEVLKFTAKVIIKYDVLENHNGLTGYMVRNNWKLGDACADGLRSYSVYSKDFADIEQMQKEVADIQDAFDYPYKWEGYYAK